MAPFVALPRSEVGVLQAISLSHESAGGLYLDPQLRPLEAPRRRHGAPSEPVELQFKASSPPYWEDRPHLTRLLSQEAGWVVRGIGKAAEGTAQDLTASAGLSEAAD